MGKRLLTLIAVLFLFLGPPTGSGRSMSAGTSQISFIDVGQGDSALLQDPNGTDILIDGGPLQAGDTVVNYLHAHTDGSLEVVLVTHADADHSGGLVTLLEDQTLSIDRIYFNGYPGDTPTWTDLVGLAASRGIPMLAAQFPAEYAWGALNVYILNPAPGLVNPDQNDASVVARIDFGQDRFLFTGDISSPVEATVVARQTPVAADVLKVAHHGSKTSSSADFLAAVHPSDGVISVGAGNLYGHPAPETLARLAAAGVKVWRTDLQGTVQAISDGTTITFLGSPLGRPAVYLPLVLNSVSAPAGANLQCHTTGLAEICAWVSTSSPGPNAEVTVFGRLLVSGAGGAGQTMTATWHYKTTNSSCSAQTDSSGTASCSRSIGKAAPGFQVNVDVSIAGYSATTWFTPQ